MSFSSRHGHRRPLPPRNKVEQAPEDLRYTLQAAMLDDYGWIGVYKTLCEALRQEADPSIFSNQWAEGPARDLLYRDLEWFEVFDLLEEYGQPDEVNASFERTGLAYEMVTGRFERTIQTYDPEGEELEVTELPEEATGVLEGRFAEPGEQWQRALIALRGRPAEPTQAIAEAIGALEGVARILGGSKDFGANINQVITHQKEDEYAKAMGASIKALYGYASQVPGARHGQWKRPGVQLAEATYVVRQCAALIAFLLSEERLRE